MKAKIFIIGFLAITLSVAVLAQGTKEVPAVTYESLYDEPYSVNKLFIGFQPLYGEVFATNVNAGFGVEASYYLKDKMDFKAHFRKTYSSSFFDLNRDLALHNSSPGVRVQPQVFTYYELGGTYHFKDFEQEGTTTMVLYKNTYKGGRWASRVPLHAEVPSKVRKIYGARLGAILWNSTADLNRALKKQGLTNSDLTSSSGKTIPLVNPNDPTQDFNVYGNMSSASVYAGASISWFRNVAVSFDKYEEGVDDGMLTLFFDLQYAASLKMDPVYYHDPAVAQPYESYSTKAVKMAPFGFRAGIDGKFNRQLSWAYGGEVGLRPSIKGQTFYAMFKITFPLFGTNLDSKVESFGK
ncbi:MAG TPA: hypothetical protein VK517_05975 [Cyclobacteriaceae bacterium]|nr:hypothetical protein [Cyclobacteriaceae bacterium]